MKKSQAITLTAVAAMGMAGGIVGLAQQPSTPAAQQPATSLTCEDRVKAAKAAGTQPMENCGHNSAAHGVSRHGFGLTGKTHSGGG
jgi:hypothetical protein